MSNLIFSPSAIFRLHKLENNYYKLTGERHRLAEEGGIRDLLESAASIKDRRVRDAYYAFLTELSEKQIEALSENGLSLHLHAILH